MKPPKKPMKPQFTPFLTKHKKSHYQLNLWHTKKTHEIPLFFPLQAFPALTHCILPAAVVPWMIVGKHVRTGSVLSWREAVKTLRAFGCFWGPSGERHSFFCGHEKWFGFSRSVHQLLPEIEGLHQDLMFFWYWIFIDQSLGRKVIPIWI